VIGPGIPTRPILRTLGCEPASRQESGTGFSAVDLAGVLLAVMRLPFSREKCDVPAAG